MSTPEPTGSRRTSSRRRRSRATFFTSAPARADLAKLERSLAGVRDLVGATDPAGLLASDRKAAVAEQLVSPDGRVAMIRLQYPAIEDTDKGALTALKTALDDARPDSSLQIEAGGDLYFTFEEAPMSVYEVVGLVAALVILLVAFGSAIAAGLPLAIGLTGLLVGTSGLSLVAYGVDIPVWAPVMASMVGLGAGIDYALFLVTRHREYLAAGLSVPESVGRALATAGQSVIFAGGTVVIAILGLATAGLPFVAAGGVGISVVVLVMVFAAITLLPALLGLAGPRITRRRARRRTTAVVPRRWNRWGAHVSRHPVAYLLGGTMLLLALAAPATALRLGMPDEGGPAGPSPSVVPTTWSARASGPARDQPAGDRRRHRR
ncbi:MAG: MMPL family transporter [Nocardioides sp.]